MAKIIFEAKASAKPPFFFSSETFLMVLEDKSLLFGIKSLTEKKEANGIFPAPESPSFSFCYFKLNNSNIVSIFQVSDKIRPDSVKPLLNMLAAEKNNPPILISAKSAKEFSILGKTYQNPQFLVSVEKPLEVLQKLKELGFPVQ